MPARDDTGPDTVLVAWGNMPDGFDFYGPFPNPYEARRWVRGHFDPEEALASRDLEARYTLVWCKTPKVPVDL